MFSKQLFPNVGGVVALTNIALSDVHPAANAEPILVKDDGNSNNSNSTHPANGPAP